MKKIISLFVSVLFVQIVAAQKEPVVMEINGKPVTKSEFLQIYLKNNNDPKYDKQTLDDYVEMFKKFKLKVAEAEALGYDTIPKLKKELEEKQQEYTTKNVDISTLDSMKIMKQQKVLKSEYFQEKI